MAIRDYALSPTTQGPLYPPSEVTDADGNFVVVGMVPMAEAKPEWAAAIVDGESEPPSFGCTGVYRIQRWLNLNALGDAANIVLHTLPLPLPANNYPVLFAPDQRPQAQSEWRPSYPLHLAPVPDERPIDGRRSVRPITLGKWLEANGMLQVTVAEDRRSALFEFEFRKLVPNSLYTVMSLRQSDLDPRGPSRPGPLGIPSVFVTSDTGGATYWARLPNPFPSERESQASRVINVVVLFMSSQKSYGGAIGWYGLGGDVHAQLKFTASGFSEFETVG